MRKRPDWFSLAFDSWLLGLEASAVVGLRLMKLAAGDAAAGVEAQRMVSEKVKALIAYQALALSGGLGTTWAGAAAKSIKHYSRPVRANRRRLMR